MPVTFKPPPIAAASKQRIPSTSSRCGKVKFDIPRCLSRRVPSRSWVDIATIGSGLRTKRVYLPVVQLPSRRPQQINRVLRGLSRRVRADEVARRKAITTARCGGCGRCSGAAVAAVLPTVSVGLAARLVASRRRSSTAAASELGEPVARTPRRPLSAAVISLRFQPSTSRRVSRYPRPRRRCRRLKTQQEHPCARSLLR